MNRVRLIILCCIALLILGSFSYSIAPDVAKQYKEYEVKASFLYHFLLFVEWPDGVFKSSEEPVVIGILGDDPYGDSLNIIKDRTVYGRKLQVKRFDKETPTIQLKECHLLFISSLSRNKIKKVLDELRNTPILTVGEAKGFGHLGGMINFVIMKGSVKFEINKTAADNAGIKIRSKLLRLAINIIGETHAGKNEN